jgi:hypothetical protein
LTAPRGPPERTQQHQQAFRPFPLPLLLPPRPSSRTLGSCAPGPAPLLETPAAPRGPSRAPCGATRAASRPSTRSSLGGWPLQRGTLRSSRARRGGCLRRGTRGWRTSSRQGAPALPAAAAVAGEGVEVQTPLLLPPRWRAPRRPSPACRQTPPAPAPPPPATTMTSATTATTTAARPLLLLPL